MLISVQPLQAQDLLLPKVVWGELTEDKKNVIPSKVLASFDGRHYVEHRRSRFPYTSYTPITVYDDKFNVLLDKKLVLGKSKKERRYFKTMEFWDGTMYIYSYATDKKAKEHALFVESVDPMTLESNGDVKRINVVGYDGFPKWNSGGTGMVWSRDTNKLLIQYALPSAKGDPERFGFAVFGPDMELDWEREYTIHYPDNRLTLVSYKVDEAGNVYALGQLYRDSKWSSKPDPAFDPILLVYRKGEDKPIEYSLDMKGNTPKNIALSVTPAGDLVCAGFYAKDGGQGIDGAYYTRLDRATGTLLSSSFLPFSRELIELNMSEKELRQSGRKSSKGKAVNEETYRLRAIEYLNDGNAMLVGERYYRTTYTAGTGENMRTVTKYHYEDILVVSIEPDGTIAWADKIPKNAETKRSLNPSVSYGMVIAEPYIYFFYNDHPDNKDYNGTGKVENVDWSSDDIPLAVSVYDAEGLVGREHLFNSKESGVTACPQRLGQLTDGRVMLFGAFRDDYRVGMLTFPNR